MAECGQVQTILSALAQSIYTDSEGNAYLNTHCVVKDCTDMPLITCDNNHISPDALLQNVIGEDECEHKAIRIAECYYQDELPIKFGGANDYFQIDGTGHVTFAGDARPWRDELGDALSIKVQGVGISTDLAESVVNFDFNAAYNANPSLADFLYKNVQMNHDKDLSATVYPHIHWFQAKDYTPNLLFQYRWQINGGAKTTSWTFLKCDNLAYAYTAGTTIHQISFSAGIPAPVGSALSDIIQFRIYRDTTNAAAQFTGTCPYNTAGNASVGVLSFDVHIQINSLGSNEEYIK
jgi:hypothetical protein